MRRRFITLLPESDFMRAMKPWVFLRFLFLGLYVSACDLGMIVFVSLTKPGLSDHSTHLLWWANKESRRNKEKARALI